MTSTKNQPGTAAMQPTLAQLSARRDLHYANAQAAKAERDWPEYFDELKLVARIDRAIARVTA